MGTVTIATHNGYHLRRITVITVLAQQGRKLRCDASDLLDALGPQWRLDITNSRRLASGLPPTGRIYA
jgi:hypothetical protein